MIKNKIKKLFHSIGLDIKKYKHPNYKWITDSDINTVLDIGANIGEFTIEYAKILPHAKFYCFEPIKNCYQQLLVTTKKININAFNVALGESNYETEINISSHLPSSSLLDMAHLHKELFMHSQLHTKELIQVKRLDDIMDGISWVPNLLVKIDVQGFEDKVIAGGYSTLKAAKIIIIEMSYQLLYENQLLFDGIYQMLSEMGFDFYGNIAQTFNPQNGKILYSDSLFIKRNLDL
jgi:FkbM family methyltransferase